MFGQCVRNLEGPLFEISSANLILYIIAGKTKTLSVPVFSAG